MHVCLALVPCSAVFGHIVQMERKWYGVAAELETGHVAGDRFIRGIQPLQICVEVASRPTGQSYVIPLDGFSRFSGNFLWVI